MKLKLVILSFCVVSLNCFSMTGRASENKITIATSGDYAPANMSDDQCADAVGATVKTNNNHVVCGFEVDLLSKVCEERKLNCEWTLEPFAWSEENPNFPGILNELVSTSPKYDLVVAYLRGNTERLEKLNATGSYIEGFPTLYKTSLVKTKSFKKNKKGFPISKKGGKKIKIAASGNYATEIVSPEFAYYTTKELKAVEVISVDTLEDQIKMLSTGEVDFVYGPNISANEFISKGHVAFLNVPQLENSIEVGSRVFAAKNDSGQLLVEQINQGLLNLFESGEYDKIFAKYSIYNSWGKQNGPKK